MHVKYRNVNEAFREMIKMFCKAGKRAQYPGSQPIERSTSRVGDVLYIQEPVTITYTHPRERVLFNRARDCNPFFHLYEALWMLAGSNDVAPLAYYNSNIANYSDDGQTFNGAYGYRWRCAYTTGNNPKLETDYPEFRIGIDQLKLIVDQLKAKPDSRRCVLQIWNVEDDLLKIDSSKDVCCNTHAYFSLRKVTTVDKRLSVTTDFYKDVMLLDMTVCNRSNDLIWGALGANVVHFSFLQEYLAACLGVEVGVYNQFTNNLHVYTDRFEPEEWLVDDEPDHYVGTSLTLVDNVVPLVKNSITFDQEVVEFVERHQRCADTCHWDEPFLKDVAEPMCLAFHWHKQRTYSQALEIIQFCKADDWRIASVNWLQKRKANYEARINKD